MGNKLKSFKTEIDVSFFKNFVKIIRDFNKFIKASIIKREFILLAVGAITMNIATAQCVDTLTILSSDTTITSGTTIKLSALNIKEGAKLTNNGTLMFVEGCEDTTNIIDFNIVGTYDGEHNGIILNTQFINGVTGVINCKTFKYDITPQSWQGNGTYPFMFRNCGTINADSIYVKYDEGIGFVTTCESMIVANEIYINQDNGPEYDMLNLNGIYKANKMTIYSNQGNVPIQIGEHCGNSDLDLITLTLKGNGSILNIKELTQIENIIINTPTTLNISGNLILGKISGGSALKLNAGDYSIISLCYNPTNGDDNLDWYGEGAISGVVFYLSDINLTEDEKNSETLISYNYQPGEHQYWHPLTDKLGPIVGYHVWENNATPLSESDISIHNIDNLIKNTHSYQECLDGYMGTILPIELVSFDVSFDVTDANSNSLNILWTTQSETDNRCFIVEYSINGNDWSELESISGAGTTSYFTNYEITFNNDIPKHLLYFRLKQVDFNGDCSYSKIIPFNNIKSNTSFKTLNMDPLKILYNKDGYRFIK